MTRSEYLERAAEAFNDGRIDGHTYDTMVMNADIFTDEEPECELPRTYAEIEEAKNLTAKYQFMDGWREYTVTKRAFEKLKEQYSISMESLLD